MVNGVTQPKTDRSGRVQAKVLYLRGSTAKYKCRGCGIAVLAHGEGALWEGRQCIGAARQRLEAAKGRCMQRAGRQAEAGT